MKTICVDLDGVLCVQSDFQGLEQLKEIPILENISKTNLLFEKGYRVFIFTARGWIWYGITEEWLKMHGVKYTQLVMGKPLADAYIDDRNKTFDEVLEEEE